jgi:hypothetical protein
LRQTSHITAKAALLIAAVSVATLAADRASAGFFDFLFNKQPGQPGQQQQQNNTFDPFGLNPQPAPPPVPHAEVGHSSGFCVRSCDGRYFPVQTRGASSPAQMCQAFCPATPTKVYFGGAIDSAQTAAGERYVDSENAFAYRKALKADCTCNGRDPTGLAPVDLSLDSTLRPGDVIATSNGLVAYSGSQTGDAQNGGFTPVANYPGLTADVRAKLGEMKVNPVNATLVDDPAPKPATPAVTPAAPKPAGGKRAALN